jgi:hypothetical protein
MDNKENPQAERARALTSAPQMLRMVVACRNASGEPDLFSCEVAASPGDGDQYELATATAKAAGYQEPMVAADESDRLFRLVEAYGSKSMRPGSSIVVISTNGAPVVEEVFSNVGDVKVIVLDSDIEGCDQDEILEVAGVPRWVGCYKPEVNVMRVADTCVELICGGRKL